MGGKSTRRTRIAALDKLFSEWIRRKDADHRGMVNCCTCGVEMRWQDSQAGHFWKRSNLATRWDPRNVHTQCPRDNLYRNGAEAEHSAYIIKEYGLVVFEELEERHRQIKKWKREEIEGLIADYKARLEGLPS